MPINENTGQLSDAPTPTGVDIFSGILGGINELAQSLQLPLEVWLPILWTESRGNASAVNCNLPPEERKGLTSITCRDWNGTPGTVPELSVGLFQKNVRAHYTAAQWAELTAEEVQSLIDHYKNPINAARERLPVLAAAWESIKSWATEQPPETWAALVSVRGQVGGSPAHPLDSGWAQHYQEVVSNTFRQLFGGGAGGAITNAIAGGVAATVGGGASAVGGAASATVGGAQSLIAGLRGALTGTFTDIVGEIDWLRVWVALLGLLLVAISVYGLVTENAGRALPIIKQVAKAVDNPAETVVEAAE